MDFGWAIYSGFSKYVQFRGRERWREYAWWMIFVLVGAVLCGFLDSMVYISPPFTLFFFLLILLPTFAMAARRLHDVNRSGWWAATILVPVVGYAVLIALAFWPGMPEPNRYGAGGAARAA
jgi:uncharacterized membrane protein YhaH (DUF805 family)